MKYTVITTFHQAGLDQYGQRMIDTFEALWPADVALVIYAENCQPRTIRPNTTVINLLEASADLRVFIDRHRDNPLAHGRAGPPEVFDPKKQFRWDAVRFSYKVFSVAHAAEHLFTDWMIWIDADTHTHTPVPMSAFDAIEDGAKLHIRDLSEAMAAVQNVHVSEVFLHDCVELVHLTRKHSDIELGCSPRAALALVHASRARAFLHGREYTIPEDFFALAEDVILHRMRLSYEALAMGRKSTDVLTEMLRSLA